MEDRIFNYLPFDGLVDMDGKRHVFVTDLNTGVSRWSKSAVDYFGMPSEYIKDVEKIWFEHVHPDDRERVEKEIRELITSQKGEHKMYYSAMNKNGEYVTCSCVGRIVPNVDGTGNLFMGFIENYDVHEMIDAVTGLSNVYAFLEESEKYRTSEEQRKGMLMIVGVNRFSDINKTYGYAYGDKLLKRFAEDISTRLSGIGKCYRLDGTKFCLTVYEEDIDIVSKIYEDIGQMAHNGYDIESNHISFSISGGAVNLLNKHISVYAMQGSLLYVLEQSKRYKHGEFVVFSDGIIEETRKKLAIMEAIRNSVFNGMDGFYLCYQPIIDVCNNKISGMEALLRWNKEPYGEVPPGIFIPWLENDPCFYMLGSWVMRTAICDAKKILTDNPDFVVNVNVSAEQIERKGFRETVGSILKELDFPAKNLCIELTERVMSLNLEFLREELTYFRNMGIKIALDDFGTGVSSMNLLLELPVDHLKIDRNFVKDIKENLSEQMIIETMSFCADKMQLDLCIEGVENEEIKEFLTRYKVAKHQGYYYSRPVVYDKFIETYNKYNS